MEILLALAGLQVPATRTADPAALPSRVPPAYSPEAPSVEQFRAPPRVESLQPVLTSIDFLVASNRVRVFLAASEENEAPEGAEWLL